MFACLWLQRCHVVCAQLMQADRIILQLIDSTGRVYIKMGRVITERVET